MTGKPLRILCVGRLKTACWISACATYEKRLKRFRRLTITEVKDMGGSLPVEQRCRLEGTRLLEAMTPQDIPIVLDERGKDISSRELSLLMQKFDLRAEGIPTFVIGGPYGLSDEVRSKARMLLRLSTMTFPHELARVVLMEQLFRSECLRYGVPYHH